ncbi:MAG: hypothetical protein AAF400_00090 [Bacteroidota bacterium]
MRKSFGIILGAVLLASLVIQDSKGVIDVIELNIPRVDAEQSTADETDVVQLTDLNSLLTSLIAKRANQKTIALKSLEFDRAENKKIGPVGDTDSEPESGPGFSKIENASNTSNIYVFDPRSQGVRRKKRRSNSTVLKKVIQPDTNNYVAQEQDVKPCILAEHALEIHKTYSERSSGATTVLCFALMGDLGNSIYIKKFATSNQELLTQAARAKAHELGYKVIRKQLSHAEGGMLQFLQEREAKHYQYLVSMGCSRLHCKECDVILKLALGINYLKLTAAIDQSDNDNIKVGEDAVSNQAYKKFFILGALQNLIKKLAGVGITIEGTHFTSASSASRLSVIEDKYGS